MDHIISVQCSGLSLRHGNLQRYRDGEHGNKTGVAPQESLTRLPDRFNDGVFGRCMLVCFMPELVEAFCKSGPAETFCELGIICCLN